jgi:hypothetical protein
MPISLPQEASSLGTGSHQRMILACTRPILVGYAGRAGHCPPPPTTTARSKPTPRLAQHRLRQLRARGSDSGRRRAGMDAAGDHADPGHPSHRLPAHRRAPGPHSGRTQRTRQCSDTGRPHRTPTPDPGQRTPTPDPGQRTPGRSDGTGHRTPVAGTGKRGHWTLAPDTGHRTPDTGHRTLAEDADRVTTARPASGPPGPPRRATARWDAQPCSCGRRLRALDSPCRLGGEAAFQREIASRRQLLGRSGGVERRLGALLSSDDYGSSVERIGRRHPLWQVHGSGVKSPVEVGALDWWGAPWCAY